MKAYQFPARITPEGNLDIPDALAKQLPNNQAVQVIILVNESEDNEEDAAWSRLDAEQFFNGYADVDSIYDEL